MLSIITTCKGRLEHLQRSLPRLMNQNTDIPYEVIVVDYGCPQNSGGWVKSFVADEVSSNLESVRAIRVNDDVTSWNASRARNIGLQYANHEWIFFIDADNLCEDWFIQRIFDKHIGPTSVACKTTGCAIGSFFIRKNLMLAVNGYDERNIGWGCEDTQLYKRIHKHIPESLISAYPVAYMNVIQHPRDMSLTFTPFNISSTEIISLAHGLNENLKKLDGVDFASDFYGQSEDSNLHICDLAQSARKPFMKLSPSNVTIITAGSSLDIELFTCALDLGQSPQIKMLGRLFQDPLNAVELLFDDLTDEVLDDKDGWFKALEQKANKLGKELVVFMTYAEMMTYGEHICRTGIKTINIHRPGTVLSFFSHAISDRKDRDEHHGNTLIPFTLGTGHAYHLANTYRDEIEHMRSFVRVRTQFNSNVPFGSFLTTKKAKIVAKRLFDIEIEGANKISADDSLNTDNIPLIIRDYNNIMSVCGPRIESLWTSF